LRLGARRRLLQCGFPQIGPESPAARQVSGPRFAPAKAAARQAESGVAGYTEVPAGQAIQSMCGITGFWAADGGNAEELTARVQRMAMTLSHRGPDDAGSWVDREAGLVLAHRRLSIVDLSPAGHQPMHSACGRYVMVFNGEVYNFVELRRELEPQGHSFRGNSDTEVMLAAIRQWGLEAALERFVGMFAFALWDRKERALHLVRDRVGIKPLYYGWAGDTFLFASELKAICAHPDFRPQVDRRALAQFLRLTCIPQPHSIYQGIRKLPPGCVLTLKERAGNKHSSEKLQPFWSLAHVAEQAARAPFKGTPQEAAGELERLLREAVRLRMVADVPLGAFLSGGIDSSAVVSLMQGESTRPVKTFTIGFHDDAFNEAAHAKAVAARLGTDHTDLYVTAPEALAVVPRLPVYYDEPFADSSQIPTYLVAALARRQVTVTLSGDGGDELFGGYGRYTVGPKMWMLLRLLPRASKRLAASMIHAFSGIKSGVATQSPVTTPGRSSQQDLGRRLERVAALLAAKQIEDLYFAIFSHWEDPAAVLEGYQNDLGKPVEIPSFKEVRSVAQRLMFFDTVLYLPDDILVKLDRASMAVSLESRVPLLDHRVVEFAARLPLSLKIRRGETKWLLRQVLGKFVPPALTDRAKMGFSIPLGDWLRGPLRDWAAALLDENRLRRDGFFQPAPILRLWQAHLAGRMGGEHQLWDVLMFQAWWDYWHAPGRC
jgi:asparagine synthase (glutamine-hydrolysing)